MRQSVSMRLERRSECHRRADLWFRHAEQRGERHGGQSRDRLCTGRRPGVFVVLLLYSEERVLRMSSRTYCSLKRTC
jgi:hypothetical protein